MGDALGGRFQLFQQQQPLVIVHPLPRQLTALSSGGGGRSGFRGCDGRYCGSSAVNCARSVSCPSIVIRSSRSEQQQRTGFFPGLPSPGALPAVKDRGRVVGGEGEGVGVVIVTASDVPASASTGQAHGSRQMRCSADGGGGAAVSAAAAAATSTVTGRAGLQVISISRSSRSASPPGTGAETSSTARDRSAAAAAAVGTGCRKRVVQDGAGNKASGGGGVVSSTHIAGRSSRNLARTKCLQWLNSFDEDD
jgi:hypothetical protein